MKKQNKLRELNAKEMKAVAGGVGARWGTVKGSNGGYIQVFMGAPSVRIDVTPIKNSNGAVGKHHETHFARTKISSTG
ncbi:hypothetical protein [Lonsdalea quercina]|uniref:hypothetical protein n=1 Tax=Lonsdalea quercina TaxID=71657 RepID=UPI003F485716